MTDKRTLRTQLASSFLLFLLSGVFLFSIPFGLALEVHHVFSEIDHDGHEHAEHDLCTWVEHHAGGSYVQDFYSASLSDDLKDFHFHLHDEWVSSLSIRIDRSRAPPTLLIFLHSYFLPISFLNTFGGVLPFPFSPKLSKKEKNLGKFGGNTMFCARKTFRLLLELGSPVYPSFLHAILCLNRNMGCNHQ